MYTVNISNKNEGEYLLSLFYLLQLRTIIISYRDTSVMFMTPVDERYDGMSVEHVEGTIWR